MREMLEILDEREIVYHRIGDLYRCLCPFHNDHKSPNLYIYPETNSWYCYRCCVGGGPVDFIKDYDDCTLREALKRASVRQPGVRVRLKKVKSNLEDKDFTDQVNLRISKLFTTGFKKVSPKRLFKYMRKLDDRVAKGNITYTEYKKMIKVFKEKLVNTEE